MLRTFGNAQMTKAAIASSLVVSVLALALSSPALALNPQPLPPGHAGWLRSRAQSAAFASRHGRGPSLDSHRLPPRLYGNQKLQQSGGAAMHPVANRLLAANNAG
jgi:hypothetical protein